MARKSRHPREKPMPPSAISVPENFPHSAAAAKFLAICSADAQRRRRPHSSRASKEKGQRTPRQNRR